MKKNPVVFFFAIFAVLSLSGALALLWAWQWPFMLGWLVCANPVAFLIWGYDKLQARRGGWRVPELALHLMALVGATPGSFAAMQFLRHKTFKTHFKLLYALFCILQLALLIWLIFGGTEDT